MICLVLLSCILNRCTDLIHDCVYTMFLWVDGEMKSESSLSRFSLLSLLMNRDNMILKVACLGWGSNLFISEMVIHYRF